jgi:hypothetical protein
VLEVERISAAMDASGFSYELLVIDDASTDATLEHPGIADKYSALKVIPFRRNGGAGTRAGSAPSRPPARSWCDRRGHDLPERADPGAGAGSGRDPSYDQVIGARTSEQGTHKLLRVPAKWLIRKIAGG